MGLYEPRRRALPRRYAIPIGYLGLGLIVAGTTWALATQTMGHWRWAGFGAVLVGGFLTGAALDSRERGR